MKLPLAVAAAAASAVLLSSCGNSPASEGTAATSAPSTMTTSSAATPTAASPSTPPAPEYKVLRKPALANTLLSLDDMPNGYADTTTKADQVDDAGTYCHYKLPYPEKTYVTRNFTKGSGFSTQLISPTIRQYASPAQAKASMLKLLSTLKTCKKFTSAGESVKVAKVKADPVGEMSVAVRLEGSTFAIVQGYSLVGPSMIAVGAGGVTSLDDDAVGPLLKKQVARYTRSATA